MKNILDNWNPRVGDKPDYYDTVKFVYKHIEFHISEDEAYAILNAFIDKWDESLGQVLDEGELTLHVLRKLHKHPYVALPRVKVRRVVQLILGYLKATGHFCQLELKAAG